MIDLPAILLAPTMALTAAWWTELLGLPVAWLRVRRAAAWTERRRQSGGLAVLKDFIGVYVFGAAVFGAIVGLATWLGTLFA